MYPKLVSVVVPAWNEEKNVVRLLDSLRAQDYPGVFEVIVVDNASTDATAAMVRSYAKHMPNVRLIEEKQKGIAFARNAGFEQAAAEIVLSTDADQQMTPHWLREHIDQFVRHPDLVGTTGLYSFTDQGVIVNWLATTLMVVSDSVHRLLWGSYPLRGGNCGIKKSAWLAAQKFNTTVPTLEDVELSIRLAKHGKIAYIPRNRTFTSFRRYEGKVFSQLLMKLQAYIAIAFFKGRISALHPGDFR